MPSLYADVKPSFMVDISAEFERRMEALFCYASQYGETAEGGGLFPDEQEIRERLGAIARFYGNLIGVKYGEPFVVKEAMRSTISWRCRCDRFRATYPAVHFPVPLVLLPPWCIL